MKKNFLISTGGSGGHVIPATILHEHLIKDANITILTDKRGLRYLDERIYRLKVIDTPKLNNFFLLPFNFFKILIQIFKSIKILKIEKIEKIISTGGYMSLPIILACKLLDKKIYLFEPNLVLGRVNKLFLSNCEKIFCYTEKIKKFPDNLKEKMVIINPLVRKEFYEKKEKKEDQNKLCLLIIGGSQGAKIFDNDLKNKIVNISKRIKIKIFHQTNKENISHLKNFYTKNKIENDTFSFDNDFAQKIQETDLCITRAGASTLAELSVLNVPFIAVPLSTSKDNHQFENAKFYEQKDCCWVLEQYLFDEKIETFLEYILANKSDYNKKKENLKKLNYQNSWINVNQKILSTINEN
tara:strand:+ start:9291 stop:10355 length:1065 start_codon:yes stop_codon:yes gene_type:complete